MERSAIRDLLEEERRSTQARLEAMTGEFDEIVAATAGANNDDEHDPEGSTIAFERAKVAALVSQARGYLDDLTRALTRLDAGTYGNCERCGAPISTERLAARPAAPTCITCAAISGPMP